jgi:hypothetical protein
LVASPAPAGGPAPLAWGTGPLVPGTDWHGRPSDGDHPLRSTPEAGRAAPADPRRLPPGGAAAGCRGRRGRATTGGHPGTRDHPPRPGAGPRVPRSARLRAGVTCRERPDAAAPPISARSRRPGAGAICSEVPDAPSPVSVQSRRPGTGAICSEAPTRRHLCRCRAGGRVPCSARLRARVTCSPRPDAPRPPAPARSRPPGAVLSAAARRRDLQPTPRGGVATGTGSCTEGSAKALGGAGSWYAGDVRRHRKDVRHAPRQA